jgi:hypothetical protein
MRWRFVDRITAFESWRMIGGRKTVTLEEYDLSTRLGREAALPETLLMESAVQLGRWLVMASSDFQSTVCLREMERFECMRECGMGDAIDITLRVEEREEARLTVSCAARVARVEVGAGRFSLDLQPIEDLFDPVAVGCLWRELHVAA